MAIKLIIGEKASGETKKAIAACNDYLLMGIGRSLAKLHQKYTECTPAEPPTKNLRVLKRWSSTYGWQARAEAYDAAIEADKQAVEKDRQRQLAERRKRIMEDGVALDYERVERLKRLATEIEAQIYYQPEVKVEGEELARRLDIGRLLDLAEGEHNPDALDEIARRIVVRLDPNDPKNKYPHLWAHDVKGLAGGRTVEVVRFNSTLLAEYRAILAEIAAETGGRRQRTVTENIDYSKLTDEQLQRVAAGEDPIQVILSDYSNEATR